MSNYWQVAAGSDGRDYSDVFLKYGMAFVGGETQEATMKMVQPGDYMILKKGMKEIQAVGVVVKRGGNPGGNGDKRWLWDVDGWDLPAYCYVDWHKPPYSINIPGLTRGTLQMTWDRTIIDAAKLCVASFPAFPFEPEPNMPVKVEDEEIIEFLVGNGLRVAAAEDLTATFRRIRRLAKYYRENVDWGEVREHETRTFLIVPLLIALGWPEQSIKIEQPVPGGRVDLALFNGPYNGNPQDAAVLIETKGFAQGLSYAPGQARGYADHFPSCKVIFVSNGYCYKAYVKEGNTFSDEPSAYLNILEPRSAYLLNPKIPGALELLGLLLKTV
ncbi:MAG: hypothetical protein HGB01_05650 [Chlorobiaceae bacterium]|nr:hypothetical protein [Chlorobiaceae bacterium]